VSYRRAITWADAEPLYPGFLTGEELLAFYRDIQQPPAGQIDQLVSRFGIASWLSARASTWSTGMTKKLSLLLAFIGRPSLILLDEPLITLDQPVIDILIELLLTYQQLNGVNLIFSSHQNPPNELLSVTKRISITNESICLLD
jgi:ABC-2 type transport system ATP-binding protein